MSDAQRAKLQAACDAVAQSIRLKHTAAETIAMLAREHGAALTTRYDGNKLRCAGVGASCTWSADTGLLDNWRKTATTRLMATS